MANNLQIEKQTTAISMLSEGNSICIERMTGVHRDTIMRLGVRVGEACSKMLDETMRNLSCSKIEIDELWGYIGKKERIASAEDSANGLGDAWTYVAIDPESKGIEGCPGLQVWKARL